MEGYGLTREEKLAILKFAGIEIYLEDIEFDPYYSWRLGSYEHNQLYRSEKRCIKEAMRWWRKRIKGE